MNQKKVSFFMISTLIIWSFIILYFFLYERESIKNEILTAIEDVNTPDTSNTINELIQIKDTDSIRDLYKSKEVLINEFPFVRNYLKDYPDLNWKEIEYDWLIIQNEIEKSGSNTQINFPFSEKGFRINRPIVVKQGQKLNFSPNTRLLDYTNDYAFKIEGGNEFPHNAITHVSINNLDIVGGDNSQGAILIKNAYLIELNNIKVSEYVNSETKAISLQDFFQINFNSLQINQIPNGVGLNIDSKEGNSGQLNLMNTIIQRSNIGIKIEGSLNLIDGINMYGGAVGNNYSTGVKIGKNVNNVNFIGSHFENHDGNTYEGTVAIDMELDDNLSIESVNLIGNLFVNNKIGIVSNNTSRVNLTGNQFDGRGIENSIAIKQGKGDRAWTISPNQFINYDTNIIENGNNHLNLSKISIDGEGAIYPQNAKAGIYSGEGNPNGNVNAIAGSIYLRSDESESKLYLKTGNESNQGWEPLN
ncbi:hypothetical protein [Alkalicoccobacillus gibsonii]|uniref:hypothetical protein n=1 Tax=Alkalicoccobacillus gibsonii TaxID=79881 RepID=UPI003512FB28